MYDVVEESAVTRVVNNAPYRGVRSAECDGNVRTVLNDVIARFSPDIVHVQHAMFLDLKFSTTAPIVWTLHDAWGWCAAGGQLVRRDTEEPGACDGPSDACAGCASRWVKDGPVGDALIGLAGSVSKTIPPSILQGAWQRLPTALREAVLAPRSPISNVQIARRRDAIRAFAGRCALMLAPSRYYADLAERNGLKRPIVLPHGVQPATGTSPTGQEAGPFVFLGTIAPHKGPELVYQAHRLAGMSRRLEIWGPPGPDPGYVATVKATGCWHGPCDDVHAVFRRARALVLGSTWPENAPLVVLEARAAGVPVIAPRIGGLPEMVHEDEDGWLYEPGDAGDLARCLIAADTGPLPCVSQPPTLDDHVDRLLGLYTNLRR